jgi:hypothetical protein
MQTQPRKPKLVSVQMRPEPPSTMDDRIEAVWTLTRACLEWRATGADGTEGDDEPRLRRSVARVLRPGR